MPSLAYILGIGGPLCGWAVIAWLLVRASNNPRVNGADEEVSAEPSARAQP
jgi:hypothetical protein